MSWNCCCVHGLAADKCYWFCMKHWFLLNRNRTDFLAAVLVIYLEYFLGLSASFSRGVLCHEIANHLEHIDHRLAVDVILGRAKGAIHVRSGIVVEWLNYLQECRNLLALSFGGLLPGNYFPFPCICLRFIHALVGCWEILIQIEFNTLLNTKYYVGRAL